MWFLAGIFAVVTTLAAPLLTTVTTAPQASGSEIVALIVQPSGLIPSSGDQHAMLHDINAMRTSLGLKPLREDSRLDAVARSRALDMLERRYFGHVAPDGRTVYESLQAFGIQYSWAGENLALDRSESAAFTALVNSQGHRENMLEPHYGRVGIAAVRTANAGEIFVQLFSN